MHVTRTLKHRIARITVAASLMLTLAITATAPAAAVGNTAITTLTLTGGALTFLVTPVSVATGTIGGSNNSYSFVVTVTDLRGSGAGWNMTGSATPFTTVVGSGYTFPVNQTTFGTGTVGACIAPLCIAPTNSVTGGTAVPDGASPVPAKFFNAAVNTGMGVVPVTQPVNVTVPSVAIAGAYTSTMTVDVTSGP